MVRILQGDCMELMRDTPDKHYNLAIVDPPYGIGINKQSQGKGGGVAKKINYKVKEWDHSTPDIHYFFELKRVSKIQIIWGGNYFLDYLGSTPCFIVWDKVNGETDFADCELAWINLKTSVRQFTWKWSGMLQQNMKNKEVRIHPTQKPVALYKWLLKNYAKEGDKILDTHLGSGSSAITAHDMKFDFTGIELDKDYFYDAKKRFKQHTAQQTLF
jgi:site-specific DNA-methyltransferase (adenine-specific)